MKVLLVLFVILLFSSPLFILVAFVIWNQNKKYRKSWDVALKLFSKYNIKNTTPIPENTKCLLFMGGKINDLYTTVYVDRIGRKYGKFITSCKFTLNESFNLPGFELSRFGQKNFETGNSTFDKQYKIQTSDPTGIKKIFSDSVISRFIEKQKEFSHGSISCNGKFFIFSFQYILGEKKTEELFSCLFELSLLLIEEGRKK